MTETAVLEAVEVYMGDSGFYMESAVFSGETKIAETSLQTGSIHREIVGTQPAAITLEGRILPSDRDFLSHL